MTLEEAKKVLAEATKHVDFINLGRTLAALGDYGYTWKTFDNSKWRPTKLQALKDSSWLAKNAGKIEEALQTYYKER